MAFVYHKNITGPDLHEPKAAYGNLQISTESQVVADSVLVTNGTISSGDVNSIKIIDQTYLTVQETGKFEIDITFTGITVGHPNKVSIVGRYEGNPSHDVWIYGYDYNIVDWVRLTADTRDFPSSSSDSTYIFTYPANNEDYVSGGESKIRIYHDSTATGTHYFYLDYIDITPETLTFANAGTYYQLTGLSEGLSKNVTLDGAAGTLTIGMGGAYSFKGNISFSGSSDIIISGTMFKNGVGGNAVSFKRKLGSNGDVGSAGGNTLVSFSEGDILDIRLKSNTNDSFISIDSMNITLIRLGD